MKREIKFRQPIKGIIIDKINAHDITLETHKSKNITWHYWGFIDDRFVSPVAGYDSQQYTELKDKNGKEIYEGDIIKTNDGFNDYIDIVDITLYGIQIGNYDFGDYNWKKAKPEVIGNIYENKNLLKK